MVAKVAEKHSPAMLGIGSDLCQNRPDTVVQWMRDGRWRKQLPLKKEPGATFPAPTDWFAGNADFPKIAAGLRDVGFSTDDVAGIMGGNWIRFYDTAFEPGAS
jgi:microsomal dipeptidase-like Zn-dependent dipeptidase